MQASATVNAGNPSLIPRVNMQGILSLIESTTLCYRTVNTPLVPVALGQLASAAQDLMALRTRPITRHAATCPWHSLTTIPSNARVIHHATMQPYRRLQTLQHAGRAVSTAATSQAAGRGSRQQQPHVLVVGAGVVGMTTALRLLTQLQGCQVSVVAHQMGWETTTAGAAGLWGPFKLWDTPETLIERWSGSTLDHLYDLLHSQHAEEAGISLRGVHALQEVKEPPPAWAHVVDQFSPVTERVLMRINRGRTLGPPIVQGWFYNSIACEGGLYLRYLHREILKHGGQVYLMPRPLSHLSQVADAAVQSAWQPAPIPDQQPPPPTEETASTSHPAKSDSIIGITLQDYLDRGGVQPQQPSTSPPSSPVSQPLPSPQFNQPSTIGAHEFDVVVNCTGIGSYQLLRDKAVSPIRGQIMRVHAPWVTAAYLLPAERVQGMIYIIPNNYSIVLGGTGVVGDWTTQPSATERQRIVAGCVDLLPSLAAARIMYDWVGLRPGRTSVRVDLDSLALPTAGGQQRTVPLVHNYGHGGSGLTLAWGCAGDVVQLVKDVLKA